MVRSKMLALQLSRRCLALPAFSALLRPFSLKYEILHVKLYFIVLELSDSLEHTWILTNQTKVRCDIADFYMKMTKLAS